MMTPFYWNPKKKILITGAAGFIGSALVRQLSALLKDQGLVDAQILLACDARDHFTNRSVLYEALPNVCDREDLIQEWGKDPQSKKYGEFGAILHMGACSSTLQLDEKYLQRMNLEYSQKLWEVARAQDIPFIYASSGATYGLGIDGKNGSDAYEDAPESMSQLKPISPYGWSKYHFDVWALEQSRLGSAPKFWSGFKFFNVYGWGEAHKGTGASMAYHWYRQISQTGSAKLFKSYRPDYKDGEQMRDFIWVRDVVDALLQTLQSYSTQKPVANGVYNLGTGRAQTWLDLAHAIFGALNKPAKIDWIEMPEDLRARYQYFTQAKMDRLLAQIPALRFSPLETGVKAYIDELRKRG